MKRFGETDVPTLFLVDIAGSLWCLTMVSVLFRSPVNSRITALMWSAYGSSHSWSQGFSLSLSIIHSLDSSSQSKGLEYLKGRDGRTSIKLRCSEEIDRRFQRRIGWITFYHVCKTHVTPRQLSPRSSAGKHYLLCSLDTPSPPSFSHRCPLPVELTSDDTCVIQTSNVSTRSRLGIRPKGSPLSMLSSSHDRTISPPSTSTPPKTQSD